MRVAVIFGGPSVEAEVSRASGAAVTSALEEAGHQVTQLELGPGVAAELSGASFDVVFPVTHGSLGEDGCFQGLLEVLGQAYVGSGVRASAVAADKITTKLVYEAAGLPVASQMIIGRGSTPSLKEVQRKLGERFVVKPARGGSAIGVSRLLGEAKPEDFASAIEQATQTSQEALIERLVSGTELTCGVLETNAGPRALPPTEIRAKAAEFYDFRSKYAEGGSQHLCPAPLRAEIREKVQQYAVRAHVALGARDLSRTDFILSTDETPVLLETNTLPGMTGVSLFPEAAQAAGISFVELLDRLVHRAFERSQGHRAVARGVALPERFA